MTDEVAATGRPPHSVSIWADNRSIYVELSGQHGPYITAYSRDHMGLAKVLELLFARSKEASSPSYVRPDIAPGYKPSGDFSHAQRERAREVLRRLKIT